MSLFNGVGHYSRSKNNGQQRRMCFDQEEIKFVENRFRVSQSLGQFVELPECLAGGKKKERSCDWKCPCVCVCNFGWNTWTRCYFFPFFFLFHSSIYFLAEKEE